MLKKKLGLILIIFSIYSCNTFSSNSESGLDIVKEKPIGNSLLGFYLPDEITKTTTQGYSKQSKSSFILKQDGILEYNQIPISTIDFTKYFQKNDSTITGLGKWEMTNLNGLELNLIFNLDSNNIFNTPIPLYKKNNKYVIYFLVGDPNKKSAAMFIQQ